MLVRICFVLCLIALLVAPAAADVFSFSTGNPDGKIATASRPSSAGKIEIESADDFVLTGQTAISSATFTGLVTGANANDIGDVRVEIYRVFPQDSDVGRTSGPPTFSTPDVPTRVNSPSDVEFDDRDSAAANLTFTTSVLSGSFTASNSVLNGINAIPGFHTGGDGAVTGDEVEFDITFTNPFDLQAGHYFFVPQVEVTDTNGEFMWLSAPRPIVAPGTPFAPDLQAWIRNETLAPDWLRVGTDIVGGSPAPTYNMAFSLNGTTIPEPSTWTLLAGALGMLALGRKKLIKR